MEHAHRPTPPCMPLHVADHLGDTRHLTTEQQGAYLLLMMALWRAGGRLPNAPERLARICGLTPSRWARSAPDLLALLRVDGGEVVHDRVLAELERAARLSGLRRRAGARGGAAAARSRESAHGAR